MSDIYADAVNDLAGIKISHGVIRISDVLVVAAFRECDFWRLWRRLTILGMTRPGSEQRLRERFAQWDKTPKDAQRECLARIGQ